MNIIHLNTTARARHGCIAVGIFFGFAIAVGGHIYQTNSVSGLIESPTHLFGTIAIGIIAGIGAAGVMLLLFTAQRYLEKKSAATALTLFGSKKATFFMGAIIFLCWLPCLLAYWPGLLTYDIPTQTNYIATGHWTTQQPPLHTLIWAFFLKMEGICGLHAITWYALAQMTFLAAAFSCVLSFLARRKTNIVLWIISAAFFALNPVIALFSITPVKDVMLAGCLIFVTLGIAEIIRNPQQFIQSIPRSIGMAAAILACCLLRSNMLVAFILFAIIAFMKLKEGRKTTIFLIGTPVILALIVIGPIYSLANITPGSSAIASVPFQQVVNIVSHHQSELDDAELAVVNAVIPVEKAIERYNPRFADSVVRLFKGRTVGTSGMRDQLVDFTKLWLSLIARYPTDAIDAFLSLNIPYWYPFAETPDPFSKRDYIETSIWKTSEHYSVNPDSKSPFLRTMYESVANYDTLNKPLITFVFSPASTLWIILFAFFLLYDSETRRNAFIALLPLLFWLSFLIGPVSNMRYLFPLFSLYPLLTCAALQPNLFWPNHPRKD